MAAAGSQKPSADTAAAEASSVSALADNIATKGESSYYYAHKPRDTALPAGTLAFGGSPIPIAGVASAAVAGAKKERVITIEPYAWADCGKSVKIYVEADALFGGSEAVRTAWTAANGGSDELDSLTVSGDHPAATLEWSERSVLLDIRLPGVDDVSGAQPIVRRLRVGTLFDNISAVKVRPKKARIVVILAKTAVAVSWASLKG